MFHPLNENSINPINATNNSHIQYYAHKTEENFDRFDFTPSQNKSQSKKSQPISSNRASNSFCKPDLFEIEEKNNPGLTTPSKKPKFNHDFELGNEMRRKTVEKSIEKFTINKYLNSPKLCKFEESPSRYLIYYK